MSESGEADGIVLAMDDVTHIAASVLTTDVRHCSLSLRAGEAALVRMSGLGERMPLGDLSLGLLEPDGGSVGYRGRDWREMGAAAACAARGTIGRVFEHGGWISNLDVDENITLAQRHHTSRAPGEIAAEAARLAAAVGLPRVPEGRPHLVRAPDLVLAAWVRALMGGPRLLVLEKPEGGAPPGAVARLARLVAASRQAGAAALWITADEQTWADGSLVPGAQRYLASDGRVEAE